MSGRVGIVAHESPKRENRGPPKFRRRERKTNAEQQGRVEEWYYLQRRERDRDKEWKERRGGPDHNPNTLGIPLDFELDQIMRRVFCNIS